MKKIILTVNIIIVSCQITGAQIVMTAEDAVGIALINNFDILVARNNSTIDRINNTAGNAGMLPDITVTGTNNFTPGNILNQKLSAGDQITSSDAQSNSFNASIGLSFQLFDGGKMFVTKKKLNEIQALGEIQFRDMVLQTIYNVILAYYDVVRQKQQLASINEVITYNLERVKISQTSLEAGLAPKTNLLQAKIDLNVYQENAINQQSVIIAAKRTLNQLLGRNPDIPFEVADSIPLNYQPDKKELAQKLDSNNTAILISQKQVDVSRLNVREMTTMLLPAINFTAGYKLSQSNYREGPPIMNRNYGFQVGGTLSIPVFQAGNASRQIRASKVQLRSAEYDLASTRLVVNGQLQNALTQFENQHQLLKIEQDNAILAKENLEITIQRLRLGQTTSLEVSLAEASFVESLTRLINFEYSLKVAETKLKQLLSRF